MPAIDHLIDNISPDLIKSFFQTKLDSFAIDQELKSVHDERFDQLEKLGTAELNESEDLLIFCCRVRTDLTARSSKKAQFEVAKRELKEEFTDGAIFIFYDDAGRFRLSLIRRHYGEKKSKYSNWKRFTYFVDPEKLNKTFRKRLDSCTFDSLKNVQNCFSVEPLSKEFYKELSHWYFWALGEIKFPNDLDLPEDTLKANAMIRLITRMIFVWFMKQKDLVPDELFDHEKLDELINRKDKTNSTYYKAILQNLFFATLSTEIPKDGRKFVKNPEYGVQHHYRYNRFIKDKELFLELMNKVPFLNGGLFENLDKIPGKNDKWPAVRIDCFSTNPKNEDRLKVPDHLFFGESQADISRFFATGNQSNVPVTGLIDLLKRYDFTIDENTPDDQEVALDPELLGLVFENLLASYNPESRETARKESGSFYTPRPIVDYMVEESLVHRLADLTGLDQEQLRVLLRSDKEQPFSTEDDRRTIIEAISNLTILDPACGSGAYPMGCLQKMTKVLEKLDPENSIWEETQRQIAKEAAAKAYENNDSEEREDRLKAVEEAFKKAQNEPDYARKLYLIENCLYGVDIQPIAMQIAKLRFFISLLVEQHVDLNEYNFGIIPLPNLETKFVAANTLIKLSQTDAIGQLGLKPDNLTKLESELEYVRERHFAARTRETKKKFRKRDKEIRKEIGQNLRDNGFPDEYAGKVSQWDPYDPNTLSEWFDPIHMFNEEGFDIVIGNPPYIQLSKALSSGNGEKYGDLYANEGYKTFARTGDIYCLFYERGFNVLKPEGVLCFITSNKWMRAAYGKKLRAFLSNSRTEVVIDMGPNVFEAATVDVNIYLGVNKKWKKSDSIKALMVKEKSDITRSTTEDFATMKNPYDDIWVVLSPIEQSIKDKIDWIGTPLKDWDIKINRGILTGYNEAFIIDGAKKDELIRADSKSAEIIRPLLRGRDIKRYSYDFADKYMIALFQV